MGEALSGLQWDLSWGGAAPCKTNTRPLSLSLKLIPQSLVLFSHSHPCICSLHFPCLRRSLGKAGIS